MVSRLLGKLDAQRQRMFGSDGVCAMACETAAAPAAAAAPRAMNLRRFMCALLGFEGACSLVESIAGANDPRQVQGSCRRRPGCRTAFAVSLLRLVSVSTVVR